MIMRLFGIVKVLIFSVHVIYLTNSTKQFDRLKSMVKHLEIRLNTEGEFRDEDIAEITLRLDGIDKVLNETVPLVTTNSKIDFESVDTLEEDFTRLRVAFTEEKSEAVRFRREIPKIENNLISLNKDVESYCKVAVNNTDQLLTNFETVKNMSEDNLITSDNDRKMLQSMAEKVQQITKQIENIETLITNLYSHMEDTLYPTSCRSYAAVNRVNKLRQGFEVYCDQTTTDGGWIVFQRRLNGQTDFYRTWAEYKNGFGDLNGEFWLGNEHLSLLTSDGEHELRIEIEDFDGNSPYALYSKFKIYTEEDNYRLEVSGYSGTAGDSLKYHNGMMFSTYDKDQDTVPDNCAKNRHGAWWYKSCCHSNLNGQYFDHPGKSNHTEITWFFWKNNHHSLKKVEMKFR